MSRMLEATHILGELFGVFLFDFQRNMPQVEREELAMVIIFVGGP